MNKTKACLNFSIILLAIFLGNLVLSISSRFLTNFSVWFPRTLGAIAAALTAAFGIIILDYFYKN
ncbi:hypothetical protein FD06_GL000718 [Apilactobacillus ozensis DSM 23829 = JCM 17196]|uniref:Uncharacterized protein n=1 Tax=Apilactobacillus ozensis DSM 23829 = JCM 17196 TaxID=1423781 RepID=A0A0R2ALK4_9LACO|nr:hypothetical protein [Apilactobacillus ozensis]KRM67567.1 hypothetical protein FD06_GL000718 [Apilactobacillus ozensis DSM 23829 = JCM 17196]